MAPLYPRVRELNKIKSALHVDACMINHDPAFVKKILLKILVIHLHANVDPLLWPHHILGSHNLTKPESELYGDACIVIIALLLSIYLSPSFIIACLLSEMFDKVKQRNEILLNYAKYMTKLLQEIR